MFFASRKAESPPLSITLLGYEKDLVGEVTAHVVLTNTGGSTIYFDRNEVEVLLPTRDAWTTNANVGWQAYSVSAPNDVVLAPGQNSVEQVKLPPYAGAWKIGYRVLTPNPRAALFNRLPPKLRRGPFASETLRDWVSEGLGEPQKVWSSVFNAHEWFHADSHLKYLRRPSITLQTDMLVRRGADRDNPNPD